MTNIEFSYLVNLFKYLSLTFNKKLTIIQLIPKGEEHFYEEAIEKYESVESLLL